MESKEVFKYSFNLVFSCPSDYLRFRLPGQKFFYRTEKIPQPTTTVEIFKSCKSFLNQTIEKYNRYQIREERTVKTTYRFYVGWDIERDGLRRLKEKTLYDVTYNIEGEEKYIIEERKYYKPSESIEGDFYIFITPNVYIFREEPETYEVETVEEYKIKQTIKSPECVICYHNPPDILYYNCLHLTVCNSCDVIGKFSKCPLCRTRIKDQRIKI